MRTPESPVELTEGAWATRRLVRVWQPGSAPLPPPVFDPRDLIVCTCGATLTEPCRTTSGNYTVHRDRVIPRRCRCGDLLPAGQRFCGDQCRADARADTYRRREQRTPTRLRRRAA